MANWNIWVALHSCSCFGLSDIEELTQYTYIGGKTSLQNRQKKLAKVSFLSISKAHTNKFLYLPTIYIYWIASMTDLMCLP
jgi:hypothetical protein